jgi:thioesterase domain-containing protein
MIIAHSVVGDEQGFDRWHMGIASNRDILVLRHPALRTGKFSAAVSIQSLSVAYAQEVIAYQGEEPFDLIGASLGAIIAHRVAILARQHGGKPRRVVLIDPPEISVLPGFLRLVACHANISFHMAAESLIIGPHIQLGGARDPESLDALQRVLDEVRSSPEHALPFILAKAGLSERSTLAQTQQAVCQAAIRIKVHRQLIQLIWDEWGGNAPAPPQPFSFTSSRGGPAIFMVTASERGAFFGFLMTQGLRNIDDSVINRMTRGNASLVRETFAKYQNARDFRQLLNDGESLERIRRDFGSALGAQALDTMNSMVRIQNDLDQYGPRAMELQVAGQHFDVVMSCISRRNEAFVFMCDSFLAADSYLATESERSSHELSQGAFTGAWHRMALEAMDALGASARKCLALERQVSQQVRSFGRAARVADNYEFAEDIVRRCSHPQEEQAGADSE